jgi:hypothetical protein
MGKFPTIIMCPLPPPIEGWGSSQRGEGLPSKIPSLQAAKLQSAVLAGVQEQPVKLASVAEMQALCSFVSKQDEKESLCEACRSIGLCLIL